MSRVVRVTFSDDVYAELKAIADEGGVDLSAVLTRAVSLEKYARDALREGCHLLVERDGDLLELRLGP